MNKISEALKTLKGPETEIIGVGRNDLPGFFKEQGYRTGVEIGVAKGNYSEILSEVGLKIYGVDPYIEYPDYSRPQIQRRLDAEFAEAKERLSRFPDYTFVRKTSMEAVKDFEDESLDFVYIDGHHSFKFVVEDIYEWSKKVRKGGCISGHDYVYSAVTQGPYVCHVKYVLPAYTRAFGIDNWYILGRGHFPKDPNETRDRWRSWMFIK